MIVKIPEVVSNFKLNTRFSIREATLLLPVLINILIQRKIWLFGLSLLLLPAFSQSQPSFTIDSSFQVDLDGYLPYYRGQICDFCLECDGNIMVVGDFSHIFNPNLPAHIIRLYPDGSIDHSFHYSVSDLIKDRPLRITDDGTNYYIGYFGSKGVSRLLHDGTVDTLFKFPIEQFNSQSFSVSNIFLCPDSKILIAGYFEKTNGDAYGLMRLLNDGAIDTNFILEKTNYEYAQIYPLPNGSFLISGWVNNLNETRSGIWRIFPNGNLDSSFNTNISNGLAICHPSNQVDEYYLSGNFNIPGLGDSIRLVKILYDGGLDTTFKFNSNIPISDVCQINDNVMICGFFKTIEEINFKQSAILNAYGRLDTTAFRNLGPELTNGFNWTVNYLLVPIPDNKLYEVGFFASYSGYFSYGIVRLKYVTNGIDDIPRTNILSIFPNPASDYLKFQFDPAWQGEITIHDLSGMEIRKTCIPQHSSLMEISLKGITKGLYIISFINKDGSVLSFKKLIKI